MRLAFAARRLALGLAAALALAGSAAAQAYDGDWEGTLAIPSGQKLRLELHVKTAGKDTSAELVSLDQGGAVIPATAVKVENGEMDALFLPIAGELKGKLSADGKTLDAVWSQGADIPLTLTRKAQAK
jgi:hypothetical protein